MNQKASAGIFIIIGLLAIVFVGFIVSQGFLNPQKASPQPSPAFTRLSDDPKYKEVKEKYNLSEEQLQILSTVDPNDND